MNRFRSLGVVCAIVFLLIGTHRAIATTSIAWNAATYSEKLNSGIPAGCGNQLYYPRMVKCPNGTLLLFAQSGNSINGGCILSCRSNDGGWTFGAWSVVKQWGNRNWFGLTINAQHANANPLVLGSELLLCYQVRAATNYDDTNTGIEVIRSSDSGATWSAPVVAVRIRNWEPRMVNMGGGILRCYYTRFDDINFVQSPNNGVSWQAPNTSQNSIRMASPVLLQNGTLKVAGENGAGNQGPEVYGGGSRYLVNTLFTGYGPQMIQIPHGDTLLVSNGQYRGTQGVWMFIGNTNATSFDGAKRPFLDTSGVWPDACLNAPDIVIVSAGNANGIRIIHGRITF